MSTATQTEELEAESPGEDVCDICVPLFEDIVPMVGTALHDAFDAGFEAGLEAAREDEWERVGDVWIDSTSLLLADPQYAPEAGRKWTEATDAIESYDVYGPIDPEKPLGVVVETGYGDGLYPVEVRNEDTVMGRRVAEVRVRFLLPELRETVLAVLSRQRQGREESLDT